MKISNMDRLRLVHQETRKTAYIVTILPKSVSLKDYRVIQQILKEDYGSRLYLDAKGRLKVAVPWGTKWDSDLKEFKQHNKLIELIPTRTFVVNRQYVKSAVDRLKGEALDY